MGQLLARNTALERPCAACTRDACVRSSSALAPRHAKRLPPESRFFVGLETFKESRKGLIPDAKGCAGGDGSCKGCRPGGR